MSEEKLEEQFWVSSIVSHRTKKGLVQIQWGEKGAQLPIEDARKIAFDLLEACEAAKTDEIMVAFGEQTLGDPSIAGFMLQWIRDHREKREKT